MTRFARPGVALLAVLLLGACAAPEPAMATLTVTTFGRPEVLSFGGARYEAQLVTNGVVAGTWEPAPGRAVTALPGDHVVVLRMTPLSDLITCVDSVIPGESKCTRDEGPPQEVCRIAVSLAPGSETELPIDLGSGSACRVGSA
jgi:hypothetical protein